MVSPAHPPAGPDAPPRLDTERLSLRIPGPDAAPRALTYVLANRSRLALWDPPRSERYFTLEGQRERLEKGLAEWRAGASARFYLYESGRASDGPVIGTCHLSAIERGPLQSARVGYAIDAAFEGRGLVLEAVNAVVRFAFETLSLHRVEAGYVPTNERSGRVLRRAGFAVEGYARDYLFVGGAWRDHVQTSITNPRPLPPPVM